MLCKEGGLMMESAEGPKPDHESDPAHNDELGQDWVDEGGATPEGPATHAESGHSHHEREQ